jgi:hypothetical protein
VATVVSLKRQLCGLQITAAFFFYFVVDGIITENVFELLAAVVLDALVLARVLFYVIAKKRKEFPGRIVLLSGITLLQVLILVCRPPPCLLVHHPYRPHPARRGWTCSFGRIS